MKSVLLIHPPSHSTLDWSGSLKANQQGEHELELGLLYIAAYLQSKGVHVEYFDSNEEELKKVLLKNRYDLVGITAYTNSIEQANHLAWIVKHFSHAKVALGGPHASALPKETKERFRNFDYVVEGEGEIAMFEILYNIKCLRKIDDLDDLPFPARNLIDFSKYTPTPGNYRQLPSTGILSSRGCPFKCTFCARYGSRDRQRVRYRSIGNVVAEIHKCINTYGIMDFRFYDDTFTVNRQRLGEFCDKVRHLGITWNCFGRVDTVNLETLKMMKQAGCYHIKYGIEFGTQKWLDKTKKGTTLEQAERAVEASKRAGLAVKASFIIGMPGETVDEIEATIQFAKRLNPHYATFGIFTPLPGSEEYQKAVEEGTLLTTDYRYYFDKKVPILKNQLDITLLKQLAQRAYKETYGSSRYLWQRVKLFLRRPNLQEIKKGLSILCSSHS